MKKIIRLTKFTLAGILMVVFQASSGQQSVTVSIGSMNRPTPKFGFNGTANIPAKPAQNIIGANWSQQRFIDSVAILAPEIIRFPGGLNSNHWDWQTGWFKPAYQPMGTTILTLRPDEFKKGLQASGAEGLFVLNLETSYAQYEMDGLRYADSLGLNPRLIELGNEHNLDGVTATTNFPLQLMAPSFYSQLSKTYYDSVKANFPSAKVCAVGGNTGKAPGWNDSVLRYVPNIDAFAFHVYLTANNADLAFDVNRALAIPFGSATNNTLGYRYTFSGFGKLPPNKEVWVTEYNLEETQIASMPIIAGTWTHLLYNTAFHHFFLSQSNVAMVLNHTLAAAPTYYESISKMDNHITANGISVKLLCDVAKGSSTCQNLIFSGNPFMTYLSTSIPKLVGWKFNHTGVEKGFICNFSADTFKVSLSGVFAKTMQFDQFFADTNLVVNGLSSIPKFSGISTDSILIQPFSITQITATLPTGIQVEYEINTTGLWIYPNPTRGGISVQTDFTMTNAEVIIYTIDGIEMEKISDVSGEHLKIATDKLAAGTYFIAIKNNNRLTTANFIVE